MANLKIDEHRLPQDGRFQVDFNNRDVAVRVASIPTLYGTTIVLRLLDAKQQQFTLRKLGCNELDTQTLKKEIEKPYGLILVTGPTGSGKTTTLYTLLQRLNKPRINICTIEDPIEYGIQGVNQTQINTKAGLTFANGLRSLLRQDPNVLMVGEIRDIDTADLAVNAAMTGHLVLSTLHTNNAFQTIQRLIEMGVQPFLAASVTSLIISQRLVRMPCQSCMSKTNSKKSIEQFSQTLPIAESLVRLKKHGLLSADSSLSHIQIIHGRGCKRCNGTGYRGRIALFELLRITPPVHEVIVKNYSENAIRTAALQEGMLTILDDGILKVLQGKTTFEEVIRATKQ